METPSDVPADYGKRNLPVVWFLVLSVVWLGIIKGVGVLVEDQTEMDPDGRLLTSDQVFWAMVVPLGAACAFVYLLITALGWWRPVLHDPKPVRRWVWAIPIVFIVAVLGGINYTGLADKGGKFTLLLVLAALFVGFSEEGMFRAVGVTSLRRHGLTEGKVALWSSVIFGLVHIANLIGGDAKAFAQAIIVSFAGYFFYLIRRVSRSNILNSILHGGFDFMLLSSTAIFAETEEANAAGVVLSILVYLVCGILVLVQRHKIEPETATAPPAPAVV